MQNTDFLTLKLDIVSGANGLLIGALINDLATARVRLAELERELEALRPKPSPSESPA